MTHWSIGTISVINGTNNQIVSNIPTEAGSWGVAVNPITNRIYETNEQTGEIFEIDGYTNKVINHMKSGISARDIALNPITDKIYVSSLFSSTLAIIDAHATTSNPVPPTEEPNQTQDNNAKSANNANLTSEQSENLMRYNALLKTMPEQLHKIMKSNTANAAPGQIENGAVDNTTSMTPEQIQNGIGDNANAATQDLNQKMQGSGSPLDTVLGELQKLTGNNATGEHNTISPTQTETSNLTQEFDKIGQKNATINSTGLNVTLLHVVCTVKKEDLGKLFEDMAVPLDDCQISE